MLEGKQERRDGGDRERQELEEREELEKEGRDQASIQIRALIEHFLAALFDCLPRSEFVSEPVYVSYFFVFEPVSHRFAAFH